MKIFLIPIAGLIGLWLGFYLGILFGAWLFPNNDWIVAEFGLLIGPTLGAFALGWSMSKAIFKRRRPLASTCNCVGLNRYRPAPRASRVGAR